MTLGRWPEWSTAAARERAKELRRDIDAGGDPLGAKKDGREAPRFKDLVDRYTEVHLPNLAKTNASDQRSMLTKLVGPDWNNRLVTEITPYDVEKLLNRISTMARLRATTVFMSTETGPATTPYSPAWATV